MTDGIFDWERDCPEIADPPEFVFDPSEFASSDELSDDDYDRIIAEATSGPSLNPYDHWTPKDGNALWYGVNVFLDNLIYDGLDLPGRSAS